MNMEKKLNKKSFTNWRLENYKARFINTIKINEDVDKFLMKLDSDHWKFSGINRYKVMSTMAYRVLPDTTDTTAVLYKIKDTQQSEKEVIYSIAYIEIKPKKAILPDILEKKYNAKINESDNIFISMICPSGSMMSKDGEYRSGVISWCILQTVLEKNPEVRKLFDYLVEHFSNVLKERKYTLVTEYYFPTDKIKNAIQFETELISASKKIQFFCITWFKFYYTYVFGFISNHINETFQKLLLKYKKDDIAFFNSLWKKFHVDAIEELRYIISNYLSSDIITLYEKTKIGQKILPLNLIEAQHFFDIEFAPWKEFFINYAVSDLVINNVSNGFSIAAGWFLIKNSDKYFFDNTSQTEKMERSSNAFKIAQLLNQAKIYTYQNVNKEDYENVLSTAYPETNITTWLSDKFKVLHNKIDDDIKYTKETIIMSNVSLCIITEFVGKTLYDSIFFSNKSQYYKKLVSISGIFSVHDQENFRKYMFQLCYNIYCLNAKLNVIHGDLHLNNMTLNPSLYKKNVKIDVESPKILYVIDDNLQYIYDNNFYDLCIIDFSRIIVNPEMVIKLRRESIPYELMSDKSRFLSKQVKDLIDYLYSSKPEFRELGISLETSLLHNFSSYFKLLTTLDLYNVTLKFIEFIKMNGNQLKNISKISMNLITDLNKASEYYISTLLPKMMSQRNFEEIDQMEYPILTIIRDTFYDNLLDVHKEDLKNVVDIYNFNNEVKYSLDEWKNFPPELKNKDSMTKDEEEYQEFSIKRRKDYELKKWKNYEVVNIIQSRQKEKYI